MARVPFPDFDSLDPDVGAQLRATEAKMGFVPANGLLFARVPGLAAAMIGLSRAVLVPGRVGMELKWLVGHVSSRVAGCKFCWAHTAHNAVHQDGADAAKFEQVWMFETSELFDGRERAALRLAAAAGAVPNAVTDAHFDELKRHFSENAIVEIVAVISLLGWLNRWCQTLAPQLEDSALAFAQKHLAPSGWTP